MSAATAEAPNRWWWVVPLLFIALFIVGLTAACMANETAREVMAKAVMYFIGAVSTPFVLETTTAILGLFIVVGFNQWRLHKEGDGWVELAVTVPDSESAVEDAHTPLNRLDSVTPEQKSERP